MTPTIVYRDHCVKCGRAGRRIIKGLDGVRRRYCDSHFKDELHAPDLEG